MAWVTEWMVMPLPKMVTQEEEQVWDMLGKESVAWSRSIDLGWVAAQALCSESQSLGGKRQGV